KVLIEAGCDPCAHNSDGMTSLHVAAAEGNVPVVEYLLSIPILLPPDILFAAVQASSHGPQVTRVLIDRGADVHALTSDGDSVLHIVMKDWDEDECLRIVKVLVDAGCDPSVYNFDGKTPLHIAAAEGHVSVVAYLLSIGI
ncbi:ankyrin, partial [Gyrodon lividus]